MHSRRSGKKEQHESMHLCVSEGEWVLMNFISPCVHDCTEDWLIQNRWVLQCAYQNDPTESHEMNSRKSCKKHGRLGC